MRWRPHPAAPSAPAQKGKAPAPPLPQNPYRRFFTPTPTFEDLVRRARKEGGGSPPASGGPAAGEHTP